MYKIMGLIAVLALLVSGCSTTKPEAKIEKNRAIQFSGKKYEALNINNANSFNIDSFKIVAEITTHTNKTGNDIIFRLGNGNGREGYVLHISKNNKLTLELIGSNGEPFDSAVVSGINISKNTKYNIELSLNNKKGELVINNVVQEFTFKNSIVHPVKPFAYIGANDHKGYPHLFSGTIDNFAFYGSKNELIAKYDFENLNGSSLSDKSGNNHDLQMLGQPRFKIDY